MGWQRSDIYHGVVNRFNICEDIWQPSMDIITTHPLDPAILLLEMYPMVIFIHEPKGVGKFIHCSVICKIKVLVAIVKSSWLKYYHGMLCRLINYGAVIYAWAVPGRTYKTCCMWYVGPGQVLTLHATLCRISCQFPGSRAWETDRAHMINEEYC